MSVWWSDDREPFNESCICLVTLQGLKTDETLRPSLTVESTKHHGVDQLRSHMSTPLAQTFRLAHQTQ